MTDRYWCEQAVVGGELASRVSLAVEAGRISSVAVDTALPSGATRLPGLTVPGFANVHSHAFHRVLRARTQADRGTFWTWRDLMYASAEALTPDNYFLLARAVFAEMVGAGMTSVGEFHYIHHQPGGRPYDNPNEMGIALLAAASEAGIRITLLDTFYQYGGLDASGPSALSAEQLRYHDSSAEAWAERVDHLETTDQARIGAGIHSVRAVGLEAMEILGRWAADRGAPIHAHVSEQPAENEQCQAAYGRTPIAVFSDVGVLGPTFTAVHATHITQDDITQLADADASVCLCPSTERDLGDGVNPGLALTEAGISIGLGSDSQAVIDHLVEMRSVELDHRLMSHERGAHSAADLLAMATVSGHAQLGWPDAGLLAEGYRADFVTVDLANPRLAGAPAEVAIENVVFAATSADITTVVRDGTTVVKDGQHLTLDVGRELTSAIEAIRL